MFADGCRKQTDPIEIQVSELKAVFFVRDFVGTRAMTNGRVWLLGEKVQGRLIEVIFRDGEVLVGSTTGYRSQAARILLFLH